MSSPSSQTVHVRYMVHDVQAAIDFYTTHLGFVVNTAALPAFADVTRGNLRLLLSGPASSAGRPMPDGRTPQPGAPGWCSATTSSPALAAGRSCWTTRRATRWSCSSRPGRSWIPPRHPLARGRR